MIHDLVMVGIVSISLGLFAFVYYDIPAIPDKE